MSRCTPDMTVQLCSCSQIAPVCPRNVYGHMTFVLNAFGCD